MTIPDEPQTLATAAQLAEQIGDAEVELSALTRQRDEAAAASVDATGRTGEGSEASCKAAYAKESGCDRRVHKQQQSIERLTAAHCEAVERELSEEISRLEQREEEALRELAEFSEKTTETMRRETEKHDARMKAYREDMHVKRLELDVLRSTLQGRLQRKRNANGSEIAALMQNREALRRSLAAVSRQLRDAESLLRGAEDEKHKAEDTHDAYTIELADAKVQTCRARVDRVAAEVEHIQGDIGALRSQLEALGGDPENH